MFTPDNVDKAKTVLSNLARKGKAYAQGITELEVKVQEATNEDKWGPHGSAMLEIAREAEDPNNAQLIMGVIYNRFKDRNSDWRLCYKALLLSEFLIKKGPMFIVDEMVGQLWQFKQLQSFVFTDADKRDQGINVRQRAGEIVNLLSSHDRIMAERQKARQTAEKYRGLSSTDVARGGLGSSSYSSSSYASSGVGSGWGGRPNGGGADGGSYSKMSSSTSLRAQPPPEDEDPFEATRRRIQQLRASNPSASPSLDRAASQAEQFTPASGSIDMDASPNLFPEMNKAGPKKLSEVKVNPAIAAALGGMSLKQSPSKQASTGAFPASGAPAAAPSAPPSAIDLLGDDFQPEPVATASHASAPPPAQPPAPTPDPPDSLFGGLDDLAGPLALSAPAQAPPAAGSVDDSEWGEMAGPVATTTGPAPTAADLSDPFTALSLGRSPAAPSLAAQPDSEFAPFVGAPLSSGAQPENLFTTQPSAQGTLEGVGSKIGGMGTFQPAVSSVPPPPSKDPFADLLN
ncbi:hypothetical protein DUNSADRAFT_8573 [Dunaliella salina]|uniref:ENTH domain-containing protein n=1 Tax=Dunaliella salina TaxID=3046 RepID=A0ABQ7GJ66_DUNSA|nr:hypothetical protein DUNSADRAFT_8573 [Dunaliella salina]|eukprot:KAF5834649.1 hypothetical protein DUNSADRAFT_8573 [Dunaliella salina]